MRSGSISRRGWAMCAPRRSVSKTPSSCSWPWVAAGGMPTSSFSRMQPFRRINDMLKKQTPENLSMADRITSLRKNTDAARPVAVDGARAPAGSRRQLVRWGLIGLGPLIVLIAALWFYVTGGRYVSTDDAFVKTDLVAINAQVTGQVTGLYVQNNQSVTAGQLLFELDPRSYQIALDQAEANLTNVKSQIDALRANYLEKAAMLKNAEETVQFQQREYNRQTNLRSSGVASEQKVDEARRAYDNAQRQTDVVRQQMAAI